MNTRITARDAARRLSMLGLLLALTVAQGCSDARPPAASISAAKATPEIQAASNWLLGGWVGHVEIDHDAAIRTQGLSGDHVASIESAKMQFRFQDNGKVAMSASVPTPEGPAARNALAKWYVTRVEDARITLRTVQEEAPTEEVIITRQGPDQFVMAAPQNFGLVRFRRVP